MTVKLKIVIMNAIAICGWLNIKIITFKKIKIVKYTEKHYLRGNTVVVFKLKNWFYQHGNIKITYFSENFGLIS